MSRYARVVKLSATCAAQTIYLQRTVQHLRDEHAEEPDKSLRMKLATVE
jgi:hypothetical protein